MTEQEYIDAAIEQFASNEIEFDDCPEVSISADGAFVQAWVWVSNE